MTNKISETAKIYSFPPRGRFALRNETDAAKAALPPGAKFVVGGAWYHDEAIAEAHPAGRKS